MSLATLALVLATTVAAFATLYVPQPILPVLAAEFGIAPTDAALLITVTLIPLGVAPLVYGYVAEAVSAKRVLRVALGLLALNQALFPVFDSYAGLLTLRFLQGLLLPAVFTALVTYCATMAGAGRVRNAVSFYIAATILGGFLGRLVGGLASEFLDWRWAFALLAALLGAAWLAARRLPSDARSRFSPVRPSAFRTVLAWPGYASAYLGLALVFSVFASLLTFVPFRLKLLDPGIAESAISLIYAGYLSGAVVAFAAPRLGVWLGGDRRGIALGAVLCLAGLAGMLSETPSGVFGAMLVLCAGFFLLHAMLSALLNHAAPNSQGVVNGLYISFYYAGGALGAWLPGFVLLGYGWAAYLTGMIAVFLAGALALRGVRRIGA